MSIRTLDWLQDDDPEPAPPDSAALLEQENQRLRQTVEQQHSTIEQLQGALRCAGKVLLPYIRAASR